MFYYNNLAQNYRGLLKQLENVPFISMSFSQFGEDVILKSLIETHCIELLDNPNIQGCYVDFGAFHPLVYSNTFALYVLGWRGLNIDANQRYIDMFNSHRSGDRNICCGVSDKRETLTYTKFNNLGARNTFDPQKVEEGLAAGCEPAEEVTLECYNVNELLEKHLESGKQIHYLSIDLEGFDERVVMAFDWQKYKPWFVSVEVHATTLQDALKSSIALHLLNNDYECVSKCDVTLFFIHSTIASKQSKVQSISQPL